MRARAIGAITVAILAIAAIALVAARLVSSSHYDRLVEEILRTPQTYSGETQDKLTALGPEGARAIGAALRGDQKFPIVLVQALERIGSPNGLRPILDFLARQPPLSVADNSFLVEQTILALKGVGNPRACAPMAAIFADDSAHVRVRVASARVLAGLCKGEIKSRAQTFIVATYEDRLRAARTEPGPPRGGTALVWQEVYPGLADADTPDSAAILMDVLRDEDPADYLLEPTIAYFATKSGAEVEQALMAIIDRGEVRSIGNRLAAAEALLAIDGPSAKKLSGRAEDLLAEARLRSAEGRVLSAETDRLRQVLLERAERVQSQARRNEDLR
jgi:HEAT repeat protein